MSSEWSNRESGAVVAGAATAVIAMHVAAQLKRAGNVEDGSMVMKAGGAVLGLTAAGALGLALLKR